MGDGQPGRSEAGEQRCGSNLGTGFSALHFEEWNEDHLQIDLLLKGGGSDA
jgi:tartrate dehydratase alpha subunit/fumarate hydratase class I-like protein